MKIANATLLAACFFFIPCFLTAQHVTGTQKINLAFSAVKGYPVRSDTLIFASPADIKYIQWTGGDSAGFSIQPLAAVKGKNHRWVCTFNPAPAFIGVARATAQAKNAAAKTIGEINLTGLSTKALEGENEAPLSAIAEVLGYRVNIGWTGLANHSRPELQGDELPFSLFQKAGRGNVEMLPVARYSPDFELPFGYYLNESAGPAKHQAGILSKADKYPEHQSLFPSLVSGNGVFDPGNQSFGFYASGPTHSAYSEDVWNMLLYPEHAVRAVRTYPLKDKAGHIFQHTYLVCFEEAKNGDYNDYVFLVKNIEPVTTSPFTTIFNGKNLLGWHTFIQGNINKMDVENNFRIEDSSLHVIGKELGYAITDKSYHNYHLKIEFKWGDRKWPPRENAKRDAGICYNIAVNEPDSIWPVSIECQIQEGDVGDFWLLGFSTITVDGKVNRPSVHTQVLKKKDAEKTNGEWNTVEVISFNGNCIHIVNGVVVNYGNEASVKDGRILLQSEYSEIFYRRVQIRQL